MPAHQPSDRPLFMPKLAWCVSRTVPFVPALACHAIAAIAAIALLIGGGHGALAETNVTPAEKFSVADGFKVELVYDVPADQQGSWVAVAVDPQGRLITSDQYGGLYRVDVSDPKNAAIEAIKIDFEGEPFGGAQGLLCAHGALYANVNSRDVPSGVYRITDTDGDDTYDKIERIIPLNGGSEHGPHAMILTPDGKRILTIAGNNTNLPEDIARSRVPMNFDEDHLLGRMPDARGHNANRMAPGGFVMSFAPDGSDIELIATGFRNPYDIALNTDGELFTYDADMEWDVGTPWYRPTRVNHVISGGEFGWRNGTGKWPAYYPDSFGAAVDIGPGSPTGICFGYGAKFPAKYSSALFIADWSYGNIHAVHLQRDGATYTGTYETFATAAPLPVTDLVVHPDDGALYFTVGGRKTQSGLYRIVYEGDEAIDPSLNEPNVAPEIAKRRELEALHLSDTDAIDDAIESLGDDDRAIRFAARIAIEKRGADAARRAIRQADGAVAQIHAAIALARTGEKSDRAAAMKTLNAITFKSMPPMQQVALLRAYALVAMRLGEPGDAAKQRLAKRYGGHFPTGRDNVDRELAQWLVYLGDAGATGNIVTAMRSSPSQESQIHYAMTLRNVDHGWNDDSRREYFSWFGDMASARGGMSFGGFLNNIKEKAVAKLDDATKAELDAVINPPADAVADATPPRALVQQWTVEELMDQIAAMTDRPDHGRGEQIFAAASCYKCHRMGMQGGILGPDLTSAGGKYGLKDLLVSIVEPNKEISDQYGATQFLTDDGRVVTGRIINMSGGGYRVMTNMLDPSSLTNVKADEVIETRESPVSLMPGGLVDTFTAEEIYQLITYLRAGGNANHPLYKDSITQR